jgi:methyl-accepting chemotaxis protein
MKRSCDALQKDVDALVAQNRAITSLGASMENRMHEMIMTTGTIMEKHIDPAKQTSAVAAANLQAQSLGQLLLAGAIALALLVLLVLAFALHESSAVKRLRTLALALSKGDFRTDISLNEKNELGEIGRALLRIKTAITGVVDQCEQLTDKAESGHLDVRAREEGFEGAYADMIRNINVMVDVFEKLLDNLPIGAMIRSRDRDVLYMNEMAKIVVGTRNIEGKNATN